MTAESPGSKRAAVLRLRVAEVDDLPCSGSHEIEGLAG